MIVCHVSPCSCTHADLLEANTVSIVRVLRCDVQERVPKELVSQQQCGARPGSRPYRGVPADDSSSSAAQDEPLPHYGHHQHRRRRHARAESRGPAPEETFTENSNFGTFLLHSTLCRLRRFEFAFNCSVQNKQTPAAIFLIASTHLTLKSRRMHFHFE